MDVIQNPFCGLPLGQGAIFLPVPCTIKEDDGIFVFSKYLPSRDIVCRDEIEVLLLDLVEGIAFQVIRFRRESYEDLLCLLFSQLLQDVIVLHQFKGQASILLLDLVLGIVLHLEV